MQAENPTGMNWVEEAISRIKGDIELNKAVSGVDFSNFLGNILHIISNFIFSARIGTKIGGSWERIDKDAPIVDSKEWGNHFLSVQFQLQAMANYLQKEIGKPVMFHETGKAITALGRIPRGYSDEESVVIEKFASEIMFSQADEDINRQAMRKFIRDYGY